jgi:type IV pilus assembly protein PilP
MTVRQQFHAWLWAALVVLAGCASGLDDLRQWVVTERQNAVPRVTPISEPKPYSPLAYSEGAAADPYGSQRLTMALRRDSVGSSSSTALIAPELNRRKEPLEAYPLDAMTMVGSLDRGGRRVALVKVDNLLHQVRTGNYLGQNYGLVTKVSEQDVTLREIVQDAAGEWIERVTTLQLQENIK